MATKYVFRFPDLAEIEAKAKGVWDNVKGILGGKGAGMAMMAKLGIPVPPGFTITTEACHYFLNEGKGHFPPELWNQVLEGLKAIEKESGKKFGDEASPLFVSCRSGAKFSMPGMMDTVLNIGLNDKTSVALAKKADERFVKDAYRRLISGFGSIVLGIPSEHFEDELKKYKKEHSYKDDPELKAADWNVLIAKFKHIIEEHKASFPQDPYEQLRQAIGAVFNSWNSKRAFAYREQTKIPHDLGTACSIVTMVFGNMGNDCATGVAFTRSPTTGENQLYGEYLTNAQGEDVVAGIRNPTPVKDMGKDFPEAYQALLDVGKKLEHHFKNMQDVEFTIENKKLYMLQCRDGKRTARSQVKIAIDMVAEGLITEDEAVKRVSPDDVNVLLLPQLDDAALKDAKKNDRVIGKGVNASPGGAVGMAVFDADTAVAWKKDGKEVVLVRPFTKPEDVHGFFASKGVLTGEGGATSHAAVVARQFGLPCIVGASTLLIDLKKRQFSATTEAGHAIVVKEGDYVSLDATKGVIYAGKLPTVAAVFEKEMELKTILQWADKIAASLCRDGKPGLQVWANADYGTDAARARQFGAMGNGLCRTEHMFFEKERLPIVQRMIMAKTPEEKQKALDELLPFQRQDFEQLFTAMQGLPVIIRLLDPPLHEFLPDHTQIVEDMHKLQLANKQHTPEYEQKEAMRLAVEDLHESNPMIGLRGCRVGVMYPAIIKMQARAIFEAALNVKATGKSVLPEIMIPLVSHVNELKTLHPVIDETAHAVFAEKKDKVHYLYGTMVETPRAALTADQVAQEAQFFSFGTNDLTQMTFGIARDDAERKFLVHYVSSGVLPANPFQTLDQDGVGQLIRGAVEKGRKVNGPNMSIGICGEVGGDPTTIEFCHRVGLSYVSCSPFRVPVARLAAAHAVIKNKK